uniref:Uncharacterized protein n=1 Tax=Ditylenchus dipsaci TaxID=166011 RepID=A0A915D861_9BILA
MPVHRLLFSSVHDCDENAQELSAGRYQQHRIMHNNPKYDVSYGDSDEPLECCRKFMLELVHQQMRKLILNAEDVARARNQSTIGYVEILFAFRRHPVFIKRLIQYMRLNDSFSSLAYSLSDAAPECKLDVGSNASDERNQRSKSLLEALKEMDVADELNQMLESTSPDETKIERIRRMTLRIQHMDTVAYEKFAIARTTSFCSRKGRNHRPTQNTSWNGWAHRTWKMASSTS